MPNFAKFQCIGVCPTFKKGMPNSFFNISWAYPYIRSFSSVFDLFMALLNAI